VRLFGPQFPWGTLFVNLVGCFFIGLSFALAERASFMTPSVRLFFVTGYLGALTTFSTYAIESVNAFTSEAYLAALANVLSNNLGGAGMVFLGLWLGRIL
jgi:CrcB protein